MGWLHSVPWVWSLLQALHGQTVSGNCNLKKLTWRVIENMMIVIDHNPELPATHLKCSALLAKNRLWSNTWKRVELSHNYWPCLQQLIWHQKPPFEHQIEWGRKIQKHVDLHWNSPLGTKGDNANVKITISSNGFILGGINIQSCSGNADYCTSVKEAF